MRSSINPSRPWRSAALLCAVIGALALAGCESDEFTVREVKERYALMLRDGASAGMMVIKAERVDPDTLDLINIRIEDGSRILHAERAELLVDPGDRSIALRLSDVVATATDGGSLRRFPEMTTRAFPLPYRVAGVAQ